MGFAVLGMAACAMIPSGVAVASPGPQPAGSSSPGVPDTLLPPGAMMPFAAKPPPKATGAVKVYKVYATREGLTGHTTANGHKIVANDHFVALPSTTTVAAKGANYYSVRVCSVVNHRCATAPVWDVGPWNTKDDYWDAHRASFTSVPRGVPEAEQAFLHHYNGGKDQFGRTVTNPAGIDLADGTIRSGLKLDGGGWATVTYLWTGGGIRGSIDTTGGSVNTRTGPSTKLAADGVAGPHAQIPIGCKYIGQKVVGSVSTTSTWYRLGHAKWISAGYVVVPKGTKIPTC